MRSTPGPNTKRKRDRWEFYIAIFKFVKAGLLYLLAFGAISLLHKDAAEVLTYRIEQLRINPFNPTIQKIIVTAGIASDRDVALASIATFVYATLFLIEGMGLYLQRIWGEYFTIFITGSFIPYEVYELFNHFTTFKLVIVIVNVITIFYLIHRLRQRKREARSSIGKPLQEGM